MSCAVAPFPSSLAPVSMVVPKAPVPRGEHGCPARPTSTPRWFDPLNGIPLASYFDERLGQELSRASRFARPVSVVLIRLRIGGGLPSAAERAVTDAVVTMIALAVGATCRDFDVVCRRDDSEVGVILPETPEADVSAFVDRIRRIVHRALLESPPTIFGVHPELTFGAAFSERGEETPFELIVRAEEAMLAARGVPAVRQAQA